MHFADVTNDIAFRKIFGNENRKEVLISFLNAVLDFPDGERIVAVSILNPYLLPKLRGGKVTIVDVMAKDEQGRTFIVEMQVGEVHGFAKRVQYYAFKSYSDQIERGEFYKQLQPVIFIGIVDFGFTESDKYLTRHRICNVETGEQILKDVEFNFIELKKFHLAEHELQTLIEKWVYFLKNAENLEVIPENTNDEGLKSAYIEANIQTWDKAELAAYDYASMREQDDRGRVELAVERAVEKAVGKAVGETEERKTIEAVKGFFQNGVSVSVIAAALNLSEERVQQILDNQ